MTNNELLHASLLDILFDGRNKEYGAYTLRRNYNQRMLLALGLGTSLILLFLLLNGLFKNDNSSGPLKPDKEEMVITMVDLEKEKQLEPEKPKPQPRQSKTPQTEVATVQNTTINIVDDKLVPITEVPDLSMLEDKISGTQTNDGDKYTGIVQPAPVQSTGSGTAEAPPVIAEIKPSSPPQFPGGFEALRKFLYRHLTPPDQLGMEPGEKKVVKVRFTVGKDGSVSLIEVIESAGNIFDKEVVRVCKKMPVWKPAIQNGEPVRTSYVLPVTFISEEQ